MNVMQYIDYKAYIRANLKHGKQLEFSKHLRCQSAFLSQVLRSKPNLSLEQGVLACEYFQLSPIESDYFMLALQLARAGSVKLESYFKNKMQSIKEEYSRVDNKIGQFEKLDDLSKTIFYSSWKFALVHVLLSIPVKNQIELIKQKTQLSKKEIDKCLDFLKTSGLIEFSEGKWSPTKKRIHLSPEDPLINLHHKNFRYLTAKHLEEKKENTFHFSSAMALSESDCDKIKTILLEAIKKAEDVLKPSPEETLRILNIDLFEPGETS